MTINPDDQLRELLAMATRDELAHALEVLSLALARHLQISGSLESGEIGDAGSALELRALRTLVVEIFLREPRTVRH